MTRLQKAAAIVALALFFAAAVAGELWEASHSPQAPQQNSASYNSNNASQNPQQEGAEKAIARYNKYLAYFTGILSIATILIGTINGFQLWLARAEFVSTHRPRIILRDVHLIGEIVHYMLVNVGDTPATIVESRIFAEFIEDRSRFAPLRSEGQNDLGRLVIAAGEPKDLTYQLPPKISFAIKIPETRRIGIEGPPVFGQRYFVGVIIYEDDLRIKRRSIFRRRWSDDSLTFARLKPEEERDHEYAD